ncbi:MAG TPA: hypothetical protein VGE59_04020 [Patescibacteria group bacterium]
MLLVFQPVRHGIAYAAFTPTSELVYDGFLTIDEWSSRHLKQRFDAELLTKVRGHGRVFTKLGIILPFADINFRGAKPATSVSLKQLATTSLRQTLLDPARLTYEAAKSAWPHLPQFFLSDTYLSDQVDRTFGLPPFSYEMNKTLNSVPYLVHSYGHRANLASVKDAKVVLSLYVGEQTSIALFEDEKLKDATISHAPFSSVMGLHSPGSLDVGFVTELVQKKRPAEVTNLFISQSGLQPMTETKLSIDDLIHIAGLVPRKDMEHLDKLSIEAIEWIELSVRNFVRSLRHSLGGFLTYSGKIDSLVINTSVVGATSPLWKLLLSGSLSKLSVHYCDISLLQAACRDLEA